MAYRGKDLVAVVAVFLLWLTFVNGDEQLIKSTCAAALKLSPCNGCELPFALACGDCLTNAIGSTSMDLQELGRASVDCAIVHAKKAWDNAIKLRGESDASASSLTTCIQNIYEGNQGVAMARVVWTDQHARVTSQLQAGGQKISECSDALKKEHADQNLIDQGLCMQRPMNIQICEEEEEKLEEKEAGDRSNNDNPRLDASNALIHKLKKETQISTNGSLGLKFESPRKAKTNSWCKWWKAFKFGEASFRIKRKRSSNVENAGLSTNKVKERKARRRRQKISQIFRRKDSKMNEDSIQFMGTNV